MSQPHNQNVGQGHVGSPWDVSSGFLCHPRPLQTLHLGTEGELLGQFLKGRRDLLGPAGASVESLALLLHGVSTAAGVSAGAAGIVVSSVPVS
jgi:hypothetical protein